MDFSIDINHIRSAIMVLLFLCFISIGLWAYQGKRKAQFSDAANLPFDDEVNHINTFNTHTPTEQVAKTQEIEKKGGHIL